MPAKLSVLVVEDEALLLFSVADELRDEGFDVFEARNADEALKVMRENPNLDVMFTDVDMPGSMDGIGLSHAVRTYYPPVQIIVTSGKTRPLERELPQGALFFSKPYSTKSLTTAIQVLKSEP